MVCLSSTVVSDRSPGERVEGKTVLQVHDSKRDCRECCCLGTHDSTWKVICRKVWCTVLCWPATCCSIEVRRMQVWVTDTFDQIILGCAVQCHAMPCHAKMCRPAPCCALLCYIMLCCAVLHHAMLCRAASCHAVPCHAGPCHAASCLAMLCHAMLRHAVPCHGMLCRAVSCLMCCALLCYQSNIPG